MHTQKVIKFTPITRTVMEPSSLFLGLYKHAQDYSINEADNRLIAMMQWVADNGDEVIVTSRGEPYIAILPYKNYLELIALREKVHRQKALQRMKAIAQHVQERNDDLTLEEAEQLADEISRETIQRMENDGKVEFQDV